MQTELDRISNQNHLQLIKAVIPHLPAPNQKRFSILIKLIEVQNVIRFYNNPPANIHTGKNSAGKMTDETSCNIPGRYPGDASEAPPPEPSEPAEPPDLLDVLADMRCYCEGEEQQMIDQALQMMSMVELFSVMAQDEASGESSDCDFHQAPSGPDSSLEKE